MHTCMHMVRVSNPVYAERNNQTLEFRCNPQVSISSGYDGSY